MKLIELEMDLEYQKNFDYIKKVQQQENLCYEKAVEKDYTTNCKLQRRKFQLMTRCMTAMVERMLLSVETKDCWKIVFECSSQIVEPVATKILQMYIVKTPFDVNAFFVADDFSKKKMIINAIQKVANYSFDNISFSLSCVFEACEKVRVANFSNEWIWCKSIKKKERKVFIKIKHGIVAVDIFMLFWDECTDIKREDLIISTAPDERIYAQYLGKLMWGPDDSAMLIAKTGETFVRFF